MNSKAVALIMVSVILTVLPTINIASAGTAASVSTVHMGADFDDYSGVVYVGTTVYIYWDGVNPSSEGDTVDITVIKPDGSILTSWLDLPPSASGTISFVANEEGTYGAFLYGFPTYHEYTTIIASTSIHVLPESVLGTSIAIIAGLAAVGTLGIVKAKRSK